MYTYFRAVSQTTNFIYCKTKDHLQLLDHASRLTDEGMLGKRLHIEMLSCILRSYSDVTLSMYRLFYNVHSRR